MVPIPGVSYEVVGFASLMEFESWLKAFTQSDSMQVSQSAVLPFLGFDEYSCEVMGKSSSIDVLPCASIDECPLFGGRDCSGSDLRGIIESGCPPV